MSTATSPLVQKEPPVQTQKENGKEDTLPITIKNKPEHFSNLYIMFYRHGMNANLTKGFYCEGGLLNAQKRAQEHCKIMGYKFIFVRPMVCSLEAEEEYKLHGSVEGELIP